MENNLEEKIKKLKELIYSINVSIVSARDIISEISGNPEELNNLASLTPSLPGTGKTSRYERDGSDKFVEGIFNGEKMIDNEGFAHPVPANYVSKSKLIEGDSLKLIVGNDGKFIYKQIKPVPRKHLVGTLSIENEQYKVIASGKSYKVILAAVTYFKASVGDRVSIIVPEMLESDWAAFDAILPNTD